MPAITTRDGSRRPHGLPKDDGVAKEGRPLRADALRNRERILEAAKRVFAERGIQATLNDVAHEAGVGVGTVYRRFADKDELIAALFDAKYRTLSDLARAAWAEPTARDALRLYLMGAFELRARDRGLAAVVVGAESHEDHIREHRERLDRVVSGLVERARDEGAVREGFTGRDIPMLALMVGAVADRMQHCGADAWRRYAQLVVDGVCPPEALTPMCGTPPDRRAIESVFATRPA